MMTKKERVLCALAGGTPDCVPYMYNTVMSAVQENILEREIDVAREPVVDGFNITGWIGDISETPTVTPSLTILPDAAQKLNLDAIGIQVLPPLFANAINNENGRHIHGGQLIDGDAFRKIQMPDPDDTMLYREIERMIAQYKQDFAMYARIRLGAASVIQSMGIDNLAYCLADEEETVAEIIAMYTDWSRRVSKNLCELDFDFFWCFDDIAFSTSMLISPSTFREYFKDALKHAASGISRPFIFHSDGDLSDVLDDIIDIGASGLHPIEPGSMDSDWLKQTYGGKLCLIGNIDIDAFLQNGTPETVDAEVKRRIAQFGKGGGYIISDSNSVPDYCKAENVIAMSNAVEKYRWIY